MPLVKSPEDLNINYIIELSNKKFFDEFIPKSIPSRRYEDIKLSPDGETITLIDKNQKDLISVVTGEFIQIKNTIYFEIKGTYSKYIRNGNITYLFEILIYELDYKIISDKEHTSPGSKEFWKSLMRRKKFSIYVINVKTNYKRLANKINEEQIWQNYSESLDSLYLDNFEQLIIDNKFDDDDFNDILLYNDDDLKFDDFDDKKSDDIIEFEYIRLAAQKYVT